jgi:hypothetical protein
MLGVSMELARFRWLDFWLSLPRNSKVMSSEKEELDIKTEIGVAELLSDTFLPED